MAIVARRVLQQLILDNGSFLTLAQRARHAAAIDRADDDSLSAEWEILVLNALAKRASVLHEPTLGKRKPDVLATLPPAQTTERFVADIATAYETSSHDRNPIHALQAALSARARRIGLKGHGFDMRVEGAMQGEPGRQQMVLKLPSRADIPDFLRERVDPFLAECVRQPSNPREVLIGEANLNLTIQFKPNASTWGMTYPSFSTMYSTTRNAVFNSLKKKTRQLRETAFAGPRGVILCGADADLRDAQGAGHGLREITAEVFRQNPSLSFVLTLWSADATLRRCQYQSRLYVNPDPHVAPSTRIQLLLQSIASLLPEPKNNSTNALNELRFWRWKRGHYFYGSWKMNENTVTISVRVLMEYLSGRMSQEEFLARHGGDQGFVSLFEQKLRQGQLLAGAEVTTVENRDDDWIVFRFGSPDPAVASLRAS